MASEGLSASPMRYLMNFLACGPGRSVVSIEDEGNEVDVWIYVKFVLFRSFGNESCSCAGC